MENQVLAVIQARCGSTRLPGKVLMNLDSQCVLWHVINRIKQAKCIGSIMVVTSVKAGDDPIAKFCTDNEIDFYRGQEDDVLDRFYQAAKIARYKYVFRMTADCPLLDPAIIDQVAAKFFNEQLDYCSNAIRHRTYPKGLDCELFTFEALSRAWHDGHEEPDREHVTWYIYHHPEIFKIDIVEQARELGEIRWTVDTQADFDFLAAVFKKLTALKQGKQPTGSPLQDNPTVFHMDEILEQCEKDLELQELQKQCQLVGYGLKDGTPGQPKPNRGTKGQKLRQETKNIYGRPAMPCSNWPTFAYTAKKSQLFDLDGIKYLDFAGCPCPLGYNNDAVNRAVIDMLDRGDVTSLIGAEPTKAAKMLMQLHSWATDIRMTGTPEDAFAIALHVAKRTTMRDKIVHVKSSPCIIDNTVAAVIVHPTVGGEAEFKKIKNEAYKVGAFVIADERLSCNRYCKAGIITTYDERPDLVVYGSSLSNGYPMGVIIGRNLELGEDLVVARCTRSAAQACTVCMGFIDDAIAHANKVGHDLYEKLKLLNSDRFVVEKVQGMNAVLYLDFKDKKDLEECVKCMLDQCILLKDVIIVSAGHDTTHVDAFMTAMRFYLNKK